MQQRSKFFISSPSHLNSCYTIPPLSTSDHKGLLVSFYTDVAIKRPSSNSWRTVWCYSHANFELASDLLDATDWHSMFSNATNVNVLWSLWHKRFLEVMDICIPKKRLPPKKHLPWLSPILLNAIKRRNSLSLVPRPHPLTRRNGLVNQVEFLGLAHAFATL